MEEIEIIAISSGLPKEEILKLAKEHNFQIFDLKNVRSEFQIKLAYLHAKKSFEEGKNITKDLMLEWLVRASGERQIKDAIERIGIKDKDIVVAYEKSSGNTKKKIIEILKGKEKKFVERDDFEIINKMVELQIEE